MKVQQTTYQAYPQPEHLFRPPFTSRQLLHEAPTSASIGRLTWEVCVDTGGMRGKNAALLSRRK